MITAAEARRLTRLVRERLRSRVERLDPSARELLGLKRARREPVRNEVATLTLVELMAKNNTLG